MTTKELGILERFSLFLLNIGLFRSVVKAKDIADILGIWHKNRDLSSMTIRELLIEMAKFETPTFVMRHLVKTADCKMELSPLWLYRRYQILASQERTGAC